MIRPGGIVSHVAYLVMMLGGLWLVGREGCFMGGVTFL